MPQYSMPGLGVVQQLSPPDSPHMSGQADKHVEQDWKKSHSQYHSYPSHSSLRTPPTYASQPDPWNPLLSSQDHASSYGDVRQGFTAGVTPQSQPDASQSSSSSFTPLRENGMPFQGRRGAYGDGSSSFSGDVTMSLRASDDDNDDEDDEPTSEQDAIDGETERPLTAAEIQRQKRKMKRFRLTHQQTRYLQAEFARDPHPDATHRERLSNDIPGLSPRQVQVWFQNKRAKLKRMTVEDRERMMTSRALPDNFNSPFLYNHANVHASQLRGHEIAQPGPTRYGTHGPPLTLETGPSASARDVYGSPTTMTPALASFHLPVSSPASADHRPPMSAGTQFNSFGFRSIGASPTLPLLGNGQDAHGMHAGGVPSMMGHLPPADHRHRQMSMDSHFAHPGSLPSPWSAVHGDTSAHDRRYSVSQAPSYHRDLAPLAPVNTSYSAIDHHHRPPHFGAPASAGPLHTSYGPGSASYPPFFDYSSAPGSGGGMYAAAHEPAYHVQMLPPPPARAERRAEDEAPAARDE